MYSSHAKRIQVFVCQWQHLFAVAVSVLIPCHGKQPAGYLLYKLGIARKLVKYFLQNIFRIFVIADALFDKARQPAAVSFNSLRKCLVPCCSHSSCYRQCIGHL